ncbi:F-box/LRR-repeat protein 6 isoform X2 [Melanotaenia boesemani]|uniref:F-box/LRR-repeat protein 6 isoform X2 n=1 Tax=Melanotaenia boesemani TaxID=1250792 RepID=UPI001C03A3C6|nr:F-box/LRR-repeat protein 6 isoform X2 [Melanotaenia boesemani]
MEASEASAQNERKEGAAPSSQGEDGSKSRKASLKRTAEAKAKKAKKARVAKLNYVVHQGEDMLLVISDTSCHHDGPAWILGKKKGSQKKKVTKGMMKSSLEKKKKKIVRPKPKLENKPDKGKEEEIQVSIRQQEADQRWGQNLPEEVLINIFQMVVDQDGAVPFLCRVGRVCRLWNVAASSPVLWRRVTVGHCWITPDKNQLPKTETKVKNTVTWLAQNRFSQLRDFSLCHWKKNVNFTLEVVSQFCPHLSSIKLSYCTGLTARAFHSLGLHSRALHTINLQYSEFQVEGFLEYLEHHGSQIKQILFSHGPKNDKLLTAIVGWCPHLELLEINTKLDSKDCELPVSITALQAVCPKLKTFRMLNVRPRPKTGRKLVSAESGFPLLEEFCIASASYSYLNDKDLMDILFGSTKLRVLDLRGCSRITSAGLAALPCPDLECLFWGQYYNSFMVTSFPKTGLPLVTQKWAQTLQQLDIANQLFTEEDLALGMSFLAQEAEADTLRSLNLSGTRITPRALRSVVEQQTALDYLNLSSCRYLPRGVKKIYRSQEEIRQLLDKLE